MRRYVHAIVITAVILCADVLTAAASSTGTRLPKGPGMMPQITLLTREYRWTWDPFRVEGDDAYAVAWITNKHQYALTLKAYCKDERGQLRALSGWHLIGPGETYRWDTRRLVGRASEKIRAVVTCKFWVDGRVDLRGQIVNSMPVRMGGGEMPWSLVTFNYENFGPAGEG